MFAILKLLSFLPFGGLLRGGSLKIIAIVGVIIALGFMYWKWKSSIEEGIRDEINVQLLEERIKEQERRTEDLLNISKRQNEIMEASIARNNQLLKRVEGERIRISSMQAAPATPPVEEALNVIRDLEARPAPKVVKPDPKAEEGSGNSVIDAWKKRLTGGDK